MYHTFNIINKNIKFYNEAIKPSLKYFSMINNKLVFIMEESNKSFSYSVKKGFCQFLVIEKLIKPMKIKFQM